MEKPDVSVILRRFETPDEVWDVGPSVGESHCQVEHVGMVLSGTATAAFEDGQVFELRAGELFYVPSEPHDSWVGGDEPYVSLHFLGADHYGKKGTAAGA